LYDVSIIIVSYNVGDYLKQCLESINQGLGSLKAEAWVVDNASTDGSSEMVKERFPQVKLITNKENIGFARANNIALKESAAPYVLLLNNDTIVTSAAIKKMVDIMKKNEEIGALGPRLLFEDGSIQISYGPMISFWNEAWQKFLQSRSRKKKGFIRNYIERRSKKSCHPHWVSAACMMLKKEAINQVGLFDEKFFMYSEDVDLCHRLRQKGWDIYYTPEVEIIHLEGKSAVTNTEKVQIEYRRSQLYFYRKYYGKWGLLLLKVYLLCKFSFPYLKALLMTKVEKQKKLTSAKNLLKLIWTY
jgi:GT2 family glycosyltransferase